VSSVPDNAIRRLNGLAPLPEPVEDMHYPMQCKWCGHVHDTGKVTVIARYTDCSVWKCPRCGVTLDDRPAGWGGAYKVDRKTGQVLL
jgi:hypothetical protein